MKKQILDDHKRVGKKFIPPLQHMINPTEINYIERILPEIAWIQFFIQNLGTKKGIKTALKFLDLSFHLEKWENHPRFGFLSNFKLFERAHWEKLKNELKDHDLLDQVISSLRPFVRSYPDHNPFGQLFDEIVDFENHDLEKVRSVISDMFDRRSHKASIAQSVITYNEITTGGVIYTENVQPPNLDSIIFDFESDDSGKACAHVRMSVNQIFAHCDPDIGDQWAEYFWNRGHLLCPLHTEYHRPERDKNIQHPVANFGNKFECYARNLLSEVWKELPVEIYRSESFEVMGALLSRQTTLACEVINNPGIWNFHSGPLFLRALVDNYITTAWILKDPLDRSRKFISHGLGQEKLKIEHLKAEYDALDDKTEKEQLKQFIDAKEAWINMQHFTFLQEVDIGSWSGMNTRQMAQEAGCLNLYRFAYTPWSQAAHGTWNHIGLFDSHASSDSLHKHIQQPFYHQHQDLDIVINTSKYLDKMYTLVINHYCIELRQEMPKEWIDKNLDTLCDKMEKYTSSSD